MEYPKSYFEALILEYELQILRLECDISHCLKMWEKAPEERHERFAEIALRRKKRLSSAE